jgi:hypothetical protein
MTLAIWRSPLALIAAGTSVLLLAGLFSLTTPARAEDVGAEQVRSGEAVEVAEAGIEGESRVELLGEEPLARDDTAFVTMGGPDGVSVLRGRAADGYRWERIAELFEPSIETDLWVANSCLDPDGTKMAIVYAPRAFANKESIFLGGAWGAIVDLHDGSVTELGRGYTLAYFNPGCGGGTFAAFTRYTEDGTTQLAAVDLSSGEPRVKVDVDGQVTSASTDSAGQLVAVADGAVVRIDDDGQTHVISESPGHPFTLQIDGHDRIAFLARESAERASAHLVGSRTDEPVELAAGALDQVGLTRTGDTFFVLGDAQVREPDRAGLRFVPEADPTARVSSSGALVVNGASPAGMRDRFAAEGDVRPSIDAWAIHSGTALRFIVNPAADASLTTSSNDELSWTSSDDPQPAAPAFLNLTPLPVVETEQGTLGSPNDPIEAERTCAVPRNDPASQAYQPKPRQVQWAVDRAVSGQLLEQRPANWRNLGMAEYTPQVMFPRVALAGGGSIPPQVMLGVLAQESNLWQASRYTAPGSTGNPIIGDFYGSRPSDGEPDNSIWNIDFAEADCGYGVGQITDGMRLAGRERPNEKALPFAQQRAIALDYTANIAMAVRMLAQKWNEVRNAGMKINNGDPARVENWFFAAWTYNTGFYPKTSNPVDPWGVGWFNNPINPIYPSNRTPFLDGKPSDAANPQWWPYPEKVLGFAAHTLDLAQTQLADEATRTYPTNYVAGFTTAWWSGEGTVGVENRKRVKPPIDQFCSMEVNRCDPKRPTSPCTLAGEPRCWWHADSTWKPDCDFSCGYGQERFDYAGYPNERDALKPELPPLTRQLSFPPNCDSPPSGVIVVDDVGSQPAVDNCARKATSGSFRFTFHTPDANGNYSGKIDLHQQGGGYNGHFSWSHMRGDNDPFDNVNDRLKITGRWSLDRSLNQWTRVWVHLPDHAGWTEQAAYTIELGNGETRTRHLPQRRYTNNWVSLGVFNVRGVPAVSLSNKVTKEHRTNVDDVAWDAVGFEPLSAKPKDFVVGLGDSYSSGEGAGAYAAWSDHDGDEPAIRNGCHQSANSWIHKTRLPGDTATIGEKAAVRSAALDFHFLACSAAETQHLMPGGPGQFGLVSQLDSGYLDENTTLVTLSIGGNDMRFGDIIAACALGGDCRDQVLNGDSKGMLDASRDRLAGEMPKRLSVLLDEIKRRAPAASIVLAGYPRLFDVGATCILVSDVNLPWLNEVTDGLRDALRSAASEARTPSRKVTFADPQPAFSGRTLCTAESAVTGLVFEFTPGDKPFSIGDNLVSQQSVHPNTTGTTFYRMTIEAVLAELQSHSESPAAD